jgi:hypothetical protein
MRKKICPENNHSTSHLNNNLHFSSTTNAKKKLTEKMSNHPAQQLHTETGRLIKRVKIN